MGDVAEMMLEGVICEECGEFIGEAVGYPRYCDTCKKDYSYSESFHSALDRMIDWNNEEMTEEEG